MPVNKPKGGKDGGKDGGGKEGEPKEGAPTDPPAPGSENPTGSDSEPDPPVLADDSEEFYTPIDGKG